MLRNGCSLTIAAAAAALVMVDGGPSSSVASPSCWSGGWTPEVCCSVPGARGNPLCWDRLVAYDRCCTETEEGSLFDRRRRDFVADMVRRGATVQFDIRHVGGGRTGAVASRTLLARSTALLVPAEQVYSLKSVPAQLAEASKRYSCEPHAWLALGLAHERSALSSPIADWIKLVPRVFANVLWFTEKQLELVRRTFFAYIADSWLEDLACMRRAADDVLWQRLGDEDLRWALSIVKTRGFAFEGGMRGESTMLIPLADFLSYNTTANIRTASFEEDSLRFLATRDILPGEELTIDYTQASNLEFLVKYGFRVDGNPYGGRQFDLGGEPLQAHCPSYILRHDIAEVVENATVDCHRQARHSSFEQQFGRAEPHEQLREDRHIFRAVEEACTQLLQMLETPRPLEEYEIGEPRSDGITALLVSEVRAERSLLQRCVEEFRRRQLENWPRPLPPTLAEPLARALGLPPTPPAEASPRPPPANVEEPKAGPATIHGIVSQDWRGVEMPRLTNGDWSTGDDTSRGRHDLRLGEELTFDLSADHEIEALAIAGGNANWAGSEVPKAIEMFTAGSLYGPWVGAASLEYGPVTGNVDERANAERRVLPVPSRPRARFVMLRFTTNRGNEAGTVLRQVAFLGERTEEPRPETTKAVAYMCASSEDEDCTCEGTLFYGRKYQTGRPGSGTHTSLDELRSTEHLERNMSGRVTCSTSALEDDPTWGYFKYCYCLPQPQTYAWRLAGHGGCRTGTGQIGTYTIADADSVSSCRSACALLPTCIAYEYGAACELHSETIASVVAGEGVECWVRQAILEAPPQRTQPLQTPEAGEPSQGSHPELDHRSFPEVQDRGLAEATPAPLPKRPAAAETVARHSEVEAVTKRPAAAERVASAFSASIDRSRVDQLLQKLQSGVSLY